MRKIRKMVSIMLCFVLCGTMNFATYGKPVKAATKITIDSWIDSGNYTKSWMNPTTQMDIYGNHGNVYEPYVIKNVKDFAALSYYSSSDSMTFEGKYITIEAAELDLSQHYWFSIGAATQFKGTILGNGCVIKNVFIGKKSEYSTLSCNGLFGNLAGNISDLNVKDFTYYVNSQHIGGLVGHWELGCIKNCTVQGVIYNKHEDACIGGVAGYRARLGDAIENCTAHVTINSYNDANKNYNDIGGLIGFIADKTNIINCNTSGEITAGSRYTVGGLFGYIQAAIIVKSCSTNVTICSGSENYAGGILGRGYGCSPSFIKCYALGNVFAEDSSVAGGFTGESNECTMNYQNCYAKGNVSAYAKSAVGGFAGTSHNDTIKQCGALGKVVAKNECNIGGFIGYIHQANILNSYSLGDVKAELSSSVGGFCGYHYTEASITNCYAKGAVEGGLGSALGGFIANQYRDNMILKRCYWNKSAEQKLDQTEREESQKVAVGYNGNNKLEAATEEFMKTKGFVAYLNEFIEQSEEIYDSWKIGYSLNNGYPYPASLKDLFYDIAGGYEEIAISEKEGSKDKEMGVYGTFVYPELPASEKPEEPQEPEDHPIHISLEWGTLEYQYTSGDYEEASNTYADGTWEPKEAGVTDLIRVINKSETDIKANFTYVPSDTNDGNYLNIKGQFEDYEAGEAVKGNVIVSAKEDEVEISKVVRFSLTGVPERRVDNEIPEQIGKIVLTVSKYETPAEEPEPSKEPAVSKEPEAAKTSETTASPESTVSPAQSQSPDETEEPKASKDAEGIEESASPEPSKDVEIIEESASPEPSKDVEITEG